VSDWDFDPEDMSELSGIFAEMIADNEDGFIMEFGISRLAAKELVDLHKQATLGIKSAQVASWMEYTKIINQVKKALKDEY
jgi:hypothetical protein